MGFGGSTHVGATLYLPLVIFICAQDNAVEMILSLNIDIGSRDQTYVTNLIQELPLPNEMSCEPS